jgi:hypothetical protein
MTEEFLELIPVKDAVIAFQHGAKQRFAKPSGTQKYRVLDGLQLRDVIGFIYKIAMFTDNGLIIGFSVQDSFFHIICLTVLLMR